MNLSAPFIRRPVMTTLVMASFVAFGLAAYGKLPVSDLPAVDFPTIQVTAQLPGASPETMAASVATPLERQFSTISGITAMNSSSGQGITQLTLEFDLERDIDAAAQDVQSMIAAASGQLPPNLPTPPTFRKVNPADSPILLFSLTSPTLPLSDLNRLGQDVVGQRISMLPGVAQLDVRGPQKYAARIELDPRALAARGIGLDEAAAALRAANSNLPTGVVQGGARAFTVEATGGLDRARDFRDVVIAFRNGAPVRVSDLGRARDGVENERAAAWSWQGGVESRAIVLAVLRQPGANTVEVARRVRELMPVVQQQLPAAARLEVLYDRSESIRESVQDVKFTLVLTLGLVVLVIFLFLRNLRATLIPSLALPVSLVGTFALMQVLGYSLDNLSLMALTLAVGFVVDDAIVMLENVVRHIELGEPPLEAAFKGSREVAFTIVSMTISARGGVPPGPLHGRDRRAALPRVRGHHRRRDPGLRGRLAHAHAHALQPLPAPRRRGRRAGAPVRRHRGGLRVVAAELRPRPRLVPRPPAHGPRLLGRGPRRDVRARRPRPEGLPPGRGHRADLRHDGGERGRELGRDGAGAARRGGARRRAARGRAVHVERRRPLHRRPDAGQHVPQARGPARAARGERDPGRPAPAPRPLPGPERHLPQPAAHQRGRRLVPRRVPVHAPGRRRGRALQGRHRARGTAARAAGAARRHERPAPRLAPGLGPDRPRPRRRPRRLARRHRGGPLRRLRRPAGLDHLRAGGPVPGHPLAPAGAPARAGRPRAPLRPVDVREARPARGGRVARPDRRPAHREPHRPAARGDPLLQPRPRDLARRGGGAGPEGGGGGAARDGLDAVPGHGAGVPELASAASACCS